MRIIYILFMSLLGVAILESGSAYADCTLSGTAVCNGSACAGENRPEGHLQYNSNYQVLQVCQNDAWQALGPFGCPAGDGCTPDHIIFVTSNTYSGNLGGLSGADAKCQALADVADLSGTYVAVLSDSTTNAKDRFTVTAPIKNTNGDTVADNAADLWDGGLNTAVGFDETGAPLSESVWTNTTFSGNLVSGIPEAVCENWTTTAEPSGPVVFGFSNQQDDRWVHTSDQLSCSNARALYCIRTTN